MIGGQESNFLKFSRKFLRQTRLGLAAGQLTIICIAAQQRSSCIHPCAQLRVRDAHTRFKASVNLVHRGTFTRRRIQRRVLLVQPLFQRLRTIIDESGPQAVASYIGNPSGFNTLAGPAFEARLSAEAPAAGFLARSGDAVASSRL